MCSYLYQSRWHVGMTRYIWPSVSRVPMAMVRWREFSSRTGGAGKMQTIASKIHTTKIWSLCNILQWTSSASRVVSNWWLVISHPQESSQLFPDVFRGSPPVYSKMSFSGSCPPRCHPLLRFWFGALMLLWLFGEQSCLGGCYFPPNAAAGEGALLSEEGTSSPAAGRTGSSGNLGSHAYQPHVSVSPQTTSPPGASDPCLSLRAWQEVDFLWMGLLSLPSLVPAAPLLTNLTARFSFSMWTSTSIYAASIPDLLLMWILPLILIWAMIHQLKIKCFLKIWRS